MDKLVKSRHQGKLLISLMLILLSLLFRTVVGGVTFPMTLGGFNGDTVIQKMAVDSAYNMVVAGISSDTAIVTTSNTNFIMYLNVGGDYWLWKK
jgi:hypothetical protein